MVDFRLLFDSVPGLFLVLLPDSEFTIVAASSAYLEATTTPREQILGRGLFEVLADSPDDPGAEGIIGLRALLQEAMAMPTVKKYPMVHAGDSVLSARAWQRAIFPVMDDSARLCYLIYQIEEVSALARLEDSNQALRQDLQRQLEKLEECRKELDSFSYSVSHDLRAPLRAIDGFARMLEEDSADQLDAEGRRKLEVIRNNTRTMGRLIDALLEFSRLGRKELNSGRLDMTALAQAAFDNAAAAAGGAPSRACLSMAPMPDATGDIVLVKQVWFNLLANAFKFTARNESAQITISAAVADGMVTYTVQDNGAGFDMRYYNKMFGMFQRLHRVSEFEGTGVGLAMVQRIVNLHGGRIWAEGMVGAGAVFHFMLPLHTPSRPLPEQRSHVDESV